MNKPKDLYRHIAATALAIQPEDVTDAQRKFAKEKTWLLLYCGGSHKAQQPPETDASTFDSVVQRAIEYLTPVIRAQFNRPLKDSLNDQTAD